jgi:hypothetical protein
MIPTTVPPAKGWVLVARRTLTIGQAVFPAGSQVPLDDVKLPNLKALLTQGLCHWVPPAKLDSRPLPKPLPASIPEPKRPAEMYIASDPDPVLAWQQTLDHAIEQFDGHSARAVDYLWTDERARNLYRLAQGLKCAAVANAIRKSGGTVVSVGPSDPAARLLP